MKKGNKAAVKNKSNDSAFNDLGFKKTIASLLDEIKALYLEDQIPWVLGYSGGKDSTTVVQLVWQALLDLTPDERKKPVYVISTDTLVENPIVAQWVSDSLHKIEISANKQGLPITSHKLTPKVNDRFWVNLLGRGYPAPRPKFRWCTVRLKISPNSDFVSNLVKSNGEAIVVLGMRKAESAVRASVLKKHGNNKRAKLSRNGNLPNSFVYTPIEDWSNDDVWVYLMQTNNPWGGDNKELLTLYKGASEGGECPLVVDTSMPSCGSSRFGCWVCTMVDQDKSMAAMINNDEEKEWMLPLLEFRNKLGNKKDRALRDFRRMGGNVQIFHDRPIPGPYKQQVRADWLKELLQIQKWIREEGPEYVRDIELISLPELHAIRKIWVFDKNKNEREDLLPAIYEEVMEKPFPVERSDENQYFGKEEYAILREECGENELQYELIRDLLSIEIKYSNMVKRTGLFNELEKAFYRSFYADEEDATNRAMRRSEALKAAKDGKYIQPTLI